MSHLSLNSYYVSDLVETGHEKMPNTAEKTGLDLGLKELCITSKEKKYEKPNTIKNMRKTCKITETTGT